ncbi:hypothetical protein [Streptococcus pneumoniae]|uniref:hypothetical protein n=1 Tax=Streptococcus pneumoniae TaxID=1313 RepID=UPI0015F1AC41|nr:hypothetical protein [Streptococcus pneumoniae]
MESAIFAFDGIRGKRLVYLLVRKMVAIATVLEVALHYIKTKHLGKWQNIPSPNNIEV